MKLLKVYLHVRNKYRQHRHIYIYIYDVVVLVYITFVVHDAQMYCVYIKIIYISMKMFLLTDDKKRG